MTHTTPEMSDREGPRRRGGNHGGSSAGRRRRRVALLDFEGSRELEPRIMLSAIQNLAGFTANTLARNDDGSTAKLTLPFSPDFYGVTEQSAWVNNNGNITFDAALGTYTPFPLNTTSHQIIAPFFADVDTAPTGSGVVTYGTDTINGHVAFGVDYFNVGYYAAADKLDTFQLILIDRSDTGTGNFDIEMNYGSIAWETGSASGGNDGLGGSSARAGYSNGTTTAGTYFELPGSAVPGSFLDTNHSTGLIYNDLGSATPGQYIFQARNGVVTRPVAFDTLSQPSITYGTATTAVSGHISSGASIPTGSVNVTLNGQTRAATINQTTGIFSTTFATAALGVAGSPYTISYAYGGDSNYSSGTATSTLTVTKATPTISWSPAAITYGTGLGPQQLDAVITAPDLTYGTPAYTPAAGTILAAGTQTLSVSLPATANYNAATATAPLTVNKANPTITWARPGYIVQGTPLGSAQLDAFVSVPGPDPTIGAITYNPAPGTILGPGLAQALAVSVASTTDYNAAAASTTIDVKRIATLGSLVSPAITYGTASDTISGQVTGVGLAPTGVVDVTLNGATQVANVSATTGAFSATFATSTLNAGSYTVAYAYPGDTYFAPASATSTLAVAKVAPTIIWAAPAAITYGTALNGTQLDAVVSVPGPDPTIGSISYSPASGAILGAGTKTLTVNVASTVNYLAGSLSVPLTVNKANPTISWPTPGAIVSGTALGPAQLDATVTVPGPDPTVGAISYIPPAGTVLPVGLGQNLIVNVTPTADYNAASASVSIDVVLAPDLVVGNIVPTLPSGSNTATPGQPATVSWTDQNIGGAAANGPWVDTVYLATDAQGHNLTPLGSFTFTGSLAVGGSARLTQAITLPSAAGTYYFAVKTNATGTVPEVTNFGNDLTVSGTPIVINPVQLPDLVVSGITPPPNGVFSGTSVPISFVVTNQGGAPTSVPVWQDYVILSQDPTLAQTYQGQLNPTGPGGDQTLNNQPIIVGFNNPSYLGVGQSYRQNVNVTLPLTAQGTWYVYVVPDGTGFHHPFAMPEASRADKLAISQPFGITLSPQPDLAVTSVQAPSQDFSGQPMSLSWTVANDGTAPTAASSWTDAVYMSPHPVLDSSATQLGTFVHQGVLAAGTSYTASGSVTLPVGVSGPLYFLVKTDAFGQVFENGATANNVGATPTAETVNLTPPPDLEAVAITAPANAEAGHALTFSYTTTNAGAGGTPNTSWNDAFYLSPTPTYNPGTAIPLGGQTHYGSLVAGASYTSTVTETLSNNLVGAYYILVDTDSGNAVFELNKANNLASSATVVQVATTPADLVVSSVGVPQVAVPGSAISIAWTVRNQGGGDTAASSWQDDVYIEANGTLDGNGLLLGSFVHDGLLDGGSSYTQTQLVTLPISLMGTYNLFVVANANNSAFEANTSNNTSSPQAITIQMQISGGTGNGGTGNGGTGDSGGGSNGGGNQQAKISDLQLTSVTGPSTGQTGGGVTVNWSVENTGPGPTNSNYWYDDIWISTNSTLGSGGVDTYLGTVQHSNPLSPGSSYSASDTITLPETLPAGNYHVIVATDRPVAPPYDGQGADLVYETNEANNETAAAGTLAVTVAPTPDLGISNVSAPTAATSGGQLAVGWSVTNTGADSGNVSITDSVYLSLDQYFDPSDRYIGSVTHRGDLAAGSSYQQNASLQLPSGLAGTYYVLVVTNSNNAIYERDTANNAEDDPQPLQITLPPPADLVAGTVMIPSNAVSGEDITIAYQVSNNGGNPANGSWVDSLYLSSTPTFNVSDPLLGHVSQTQDLAPGASYTGTLTAPLPGITPGTYYVILRTNILNSFPELTQANNLSASLTQTSIDVPALTVDTPSTGTLSQGQSAYYKVVVPAGETLDVALTSQSATALNELYVSYGTVPTRAQYDFRYGDPFQPDQQITIPTTQAGTYYILAYGAGVPSGTEIETLTATAVPFSITTVGPGQVDNGGPSTLEIQGAQFDRSTTFELIDPANDVITAQAVYFQDAGTVYATFDLTKQRLGSYTVRAIDGGSTASLLAGLKVASVPTAVNQPPADGAINGSLETYLTGPSISLPNRINSFTITFANLSGHDLTAPLLEVTSPANTTIGFTPTDVHSGVYLEFVGVSPTGPAGILRPGETVTKTLYFESAAQAGLINSVELQVFQTDDPSPLNLQPYLLPSTIAQANYPSIYANLQQRVGSTWGDYVATLAHEATLLPAVMGDNSDPLTLLNLAVTASTAAVDTSITGEATSPGLLVPISGQVMVATNRTTGESFSTDTLVDGSFTFPSVTPGTYVLSSQSAILVDPPTFVVASGQALKGVSVDLSGGFVLSGTVRSQQTNEPLASAIIEAIGSSGSLFSTTSDGLGDYLFNALPPDTYTLIAEAPGFARTFLAGVVVTSVDVSAPIEMAAASEIEGIADLATGGPSGGVLQIVAKPDGVTDPNQVYDGNVSGDQFSLVDLPSGVYDLQITIAGYLPVTLDGISVTTGGVTNVGTVDLSLNSTISGSIISTDPGVPAADEPIGLYQGTTQVGSATSDSNGAYSFNDVGPGTYTVELYDGSPLATSPVVVVAPGSNPTNIDLVVVPGGTIEGSATDSLTETPLANIEVLITDGRGEVSTAYTDSRGNYQLSNLTAGTYDVRLTLDGVDADRSVTITALDGTAVTANLSIALSASLAGVVYDGQGNPIANATVALMQSGELIDSLSTDSNGHYSFYIVQPGTYTLQASSLAASFLPVDDIQVSGTSAITQDIRSGSGSLQIDVADPGQSLAGDSVALYLEGTVAPIPCGFATLDASGMATFGDLSDGTYVARVAGADDHGQAAAAHLVGGVNVEIGVSLVQQLTLSGVVDDSSDNPLSGAIVRLVNTLDASDQYSVGTSANGQYSIANIPTGTYDLTVRLDGYTTLVQPGIALSGSTSLNETLGSNGSWLRGRVVDSLGNPIVGASVVLVDSLGHLLAEETTDSNGAFADDSAFGQQLTVRISSPGYFQASLTGITLGTNTPLDLGTISLTPASIADPEGGGIFSNIGYYLGKPLEWAEDLGATVSFIGSQFSSLPPAPTLSDAPSCVEPDPYLDQLRQNATDALARRSQLEDQFHDANQEVLSDVTETELLAAADGLFAAGLLSGIGGALYATTLADGVILADGATLIDEVGIFGTYYPASTLKSFYAITGGMYGIESLLMDWANNSKEISSTTESTWVSSVGAADDDLTNVIATASGVAQLIQNNIAKFADIGLIKLALSDELTRVNAFLGAVALVHNGVFPHAEETGNETEENAYHFYDIQDQFQQANANATQLVKQYNDAVADAARDGVCNPQPTSPPPGCPGGSFGCPTGNYKDPNNILGPQGFGDQGYVSIGRPLPYSIQFENEPTATLPTPQVVITQQLSSNLDWRTFRLGSFGFDGMIFEVPADSAYYQTVIDLTSTKGYDVDVTATIDERTGIATWFFTTIDPTTGEIPLDPTVGFLPPDDSSGSGEGFVSYTVMANQADPTGTVINAQATVTFDTEPPIITPLIFNTIDTGSGLVSAVAPLPGTESTSQFLVSWAGTDSSAGSAIATYTIEVSEDGSPFVVWLADTTLTSAPFAGAIGHSFAFTSMAVDNVGNVEPGHTSADTSTLVVGLAPSPATNLAISPDTGSSTTDGVSDTGAIVLSGTVGQYATTIEVYDTTTNVDLGAATISGSSFSTPTLNLAEGTHHLRVRSSNNTGLVADAFFDVLVDATPPTSRVNALPDVATSYAIIVGVTGSDPGVTPSGVIAYALYVAIDNGPFSTTPWAIVPASSPTAIYQAQPGHNYYFRSVATDAAGNVEQKAVTIEAGTYVPDLTLPTTVVASATANPLTALFTVAVTGTDAGSSGLATFQVFVQVDGGAIQQVASVAAGTPDPSGNYSDLIVYQASADGTSHTYRFFSKGIDGAGNVEADHASPDDIVVTQTFQVQPLQVTHLLVQDGEAERSFISVIDLDFNEADGGTSTPLADLIAEGRITLIQHPLSGVISPDDPRVPLNGLLSVVDHAIEIDFGQYGLGGAARGNLSLNDYWSDMAGGDGYYELDVDLNGDGVITLNEQFFFYRLLGDVDGRETVDNTDVTEITAALGQTGVLIPLDVNGDGSVDTTDKALAIKSKGRSLASGLRIDG